MNQKADFGTVLEPLPIVNTKYGKIVGSTLDRIAVFRGVPYGGRCDRELRFMPPREPERWSGVRDCTKNGAICVQTAGSICDPILAGGHPEKLGLKYETQDENCLFLNVLTPGIDRRKRPVMVYIHGGGYWQLSGTILTAADNLPREQDIVTVSLNHRLHVLGYLYLGDIDPTYADSGNVGHMDILLALKWVRDNIEAFGGDPDNVTIMGESGGSDKVLTLTHMPEAKGLFHKAIAISCFLPVGRITKELATSYTLDVLRILDIPTNHLERLLELPARYILEKVFDPRTHLWCMTFAPVADGIHLFPGIGNGYVPAFDTAVPLIVGASEDELSSFSAEDSFGINAGNFRESVLAKSKHYGLPIDEGSVDQVLKTFRDTNVKHDTPDHLFLKMISIKSFMGGAHYLAEDYARMGKGPVYQFLDRYDAPHDAHPERTYAGHCVNLYGAFRLVGYPQMEEYSKHIASMYCAFMRTGNPSTAELEWPAFDMEHRATMVYDKEFKLTADPIRKEREALDRAAGHDGPVDCYVGEQYKYPLSIEHP